MSEVMTQHGATLVAPTSRQDVVSELLDDYTYDESYDAEDMSLQSGLAPAFNELPQHPPRAESIKDPKAEAYQRMNTKFQLRGKRCALHFIPQDVLRGADAWHRLASLASLYASAVTRTS
jgi:hypothetical protein